MSADIQGVLSYAVCSCIQTGADWLIENCTEIHEIEKSGQETRAWFAQFSSKVVFIKWYPTDLRESWMKVESDIAGSNLHSAIVPLMKVINCADGSLLIYPRIAGENLASQDSRVKFGKLPLENRVAAVITVSQTLAAVCNHNYMIVDWYEGNMIYDFEAKNIWLFDWELCREGSSFLLEIDSNYGSSRLMAPEEFVRGSTLNESTLVFNLGRYALLTLPELADLLAPVLARATYPSRSGRYRTVHEYLTELVKAFKNNSLNL